MKGGGVVVLYGGRRSVFLHKEESESGSRDEAGGVVGRPVAEGEGTITQAWLLP